MQNFLNSLFNNPHTSWSAVALVACKAVGIFFPKYKDQFDELANVAIMYGLIRAGDAGATQTTTPTTPATPAAPTKP